MKKINKNDKPLERQSKKKKDRRYTLTASPSGNTTKTMAKEQTKALNPENKESQREDNSCKILEGRKQKSELT